MVVQLTGILHHFFGAYNLADCTAGTVMLRKALVFTSSGKSVYDCNLVSFAPRLRILAPCVEKAETFVSSNSCMSQSEALRVRCTLALAKLCNLCKEVGAPTSPLDLKHLLHRTSVARYIILDSQ